MNKSKKSLANFYMRRVFRIVPIYVVLLLIFAILKYGVRFDNVWLLGDADFKIWPYFLFVQNFYMADIGSFGPNWLGVSWSLAVEEQFYLILPFLVFVFRNNRAALLGTICLLIVLAPWFRYLYQEGIGAYMMVFCRADALLCGVLAAILCRYEFEGKTDLLINCMAAALCLISLLSVMSHFNTAKLFSIRLHSELAIFCASLIYLIVKFRGARILAPLRTQSMVFIGAISYALYLVHQPVSGLLFQFSGKSEPSLIELSDLWIVLTAIFVSVIISYLSLVFFEKPLRRYAANRWPKSS